MTYNFWRKDNIRTQDFKNTHWNCILQSVVNVNNLIHTKNVRINITNHLLPHYKIPKRPNITSTAISIRPFITFNQYNMRELYDMEIHIQDFKFKQMKNVCFIKHKLNHNKNQLRHDISKICNNYARFEYMECSTLPELNKINNKITNMHGIIVFFILKNIDGKNFRHYRNVYEISKKLNQNNIKTYPMLKLCCSGIFK